jgi:diaminopimelate decarboxylase
MTTGGKSQTPTIVFPPGHTREAGELVLGGVPAHHLAAAYGTPLLVLDYDVLDEALSRFLAACEPHGVEIAYAGKALLLVGLVQHLKHTPLNLDVSSLGELATAERAGFPAERMNMHGCGKTADEIDAAVEGRVGRIIVDNLDELRALAARAPQHQIRLLLRINTGIEAHTHDFVRTSGAQSKFGLDPDALERALEILGGADGLRFLGLHSHIGSQIFDEEPFVANAQALMASAARCAAAGLQTEQIIVGGGFGVQTHPEEPVALEPRDTIATLARAVAEEAQRYGLPRPRLGIEPGRAIAAAAGTTLYAVMAAKHQFGRPYAIVDGGIYENPRPALYGAYHHVVPASPARGQLTGTTVCGRTCENDRLGEGSLPQNLAAGDLIAFCTTGAYTYSMAGNYNRFPRPAVAAVRQGTHSLLARRDSIDDILRNDIDA